MTARGGRCSGLCGQTSWKAWVTLVAMLLFTITCGVIYSYGKYLFVYASESKCDGLGYRHMVNVALGTVRDKKY